MAGLARLFTRHGHELALVGGSVRDVFLGRGHGDLDLTTDARPEQVLEIAEGWADAVWEIGIDFGTVGLRKGSTICEITTYRSESYRHDSRKPKVDYGTSLEATTCRGATSPSTRWPPGCPRWSWPTRSAGSPT